MARKSKKSNTSPVALATALAALVGMVAVIFFLSPRSVPYRTKEDFPVSSFMENASNLRGNTYRLEAEVVNSLAMSPKSGRLIAVQPSGKQILPILLPAQFEKINIQKGQKFVFLLKVDDRGLPEVLDLTKS